MGSILKKCYLFLALTLVSTLTFAGSQQGTITSLMTRYDGAIFVTLSGSATGQPACATHNYWLVHDETTQGGKQQYAQLTAAYMAGKTITITGLGNCTRWGDGEDIMYISY